jgi:predicted helicase
MNLQEYIDKLNRRFKLGNSTEHTFRGDLQYLIEDLIPHVSATNEPAGQKCGKPDYVLMKNDIPLGYIEAKDVGEKDLEGKKINKKQFDRYKFALNNLIFTDYLSFHFYRDGEKNGEIVSIGKIENGSIVAIPENFTTFIDRIKDFCAAKGTQTIRSSKKLSAMMAGKARLLSNIIELALNSDETHQEDSTLKDQMEAFKDILIHDINAEAFADIYAQTITYGMFAARLHDPTLPTFSRQEAAELIPKSNPFLRKLFGYIAGPDLDNRIKWIVDDLVEIFLACNVAEILKDYGKSSGMEDPIIHFYENFLSEYDPALRKARGVWYTPQPVVSFIVRAIDEILKTEFQLPQGLADTSKTTVNLQTQNYDKRTKKYTETTEEVHKVQILDPATGTGTFLAETIKHIHKKFAGQKGLWSNYVENHLLPRLNGFELLMASYAMAHLQLDLLLTETGYKPTKDQRFRVYLTNSLEEHHPDTSTLFANWLSSEANEANHIKRDNPVMIVMGNPPYSVSSNNKSEWIEKLTADYKKDLNERNIQPLSDDYIKFIRFGQHFIDKNGEGILAYISNNSFIDGIIHRQMRKHLLESFDSIYILDLHGNAKRKEVALDGSADQNVFDIMQGVSINLLVKTGKKKVGELAKVKHFDLQGKRNFKYEFLTENSLKSLEWNDLQPNEPNFFLVKKDFDESGIYENGFKIDELLVENASGIKTERDSLTIHYDDKKLSEIEKAILELDEETFRKKYTPKPDGRDWKISTAKADIQKSIKFKINVLYRPFDIRRTIYTGKTKGFHSYPRHDIMKHLLKDNIALTTCRQQSTFDFQHILVSKYIIDMCTVSLQTKETTYAFPLYIYPEPTNDLFAKAERTPNLKQAIIDKIAEGLALKFTSEKEETKGTFSPIDVLDYIYAVLHSPTYREKYKEFLKIDFPRVPYPKDLPTFWKLVKLGGEIRAIHLLESPVVEEYITEYPEDGNNIVLKPKYENGRVYINENQYFDKVPETAWNFYIGGYQPAQKWLKDRKERELSFEDILHYQKIIVALTETARIMKEVDLVGVEW